MKRTILLSVFLTIIVICGMLPSACSRGFSHQPSTINQMKLLVTPQDQTVTQALQEALATPEMSVSDAPFLMVADINKIRLWVYSNIKQDSDFALHGVSDYWQTPAETLVLRAGDCEDFAILTVSMMRAYGVPQDQVYIAVGTDTNKDWHAFVIERYSYGAWVEFDPESLDDAVLLGGNMSLPYDLSCCFNDQSGFNGTPVYPLDYSVPPASIIPVLPAPVIAPPRYLDNLDEAKQQLGELWLPAYVPQGYFLTARFAYSISDKWQFVMEYQGENGLQLTILEHNGTGALIEALYPSGTFEQVTVNNQPACLGAIPATIQTATSLRTTSSLLLNFIMGRLKIFVSVMPADSLPGEELIKIAESLAPY